MVRIRLSKKGRKNAPSYRIIVTDKKAKRDGQYIELLGHYNPIENPEKPVYNQERYDYWISVGAQPSDAVAKLVKGTYEFKPYNPNAAEETEEESETVKAEESNENEEASDTDTEAAEETKAE